LLAQAWGSPGVCDMEESPSGFPFSMA